MAILGILVAIAIPVFGTIQDRARDNALKTITANAATQVAAALANGDAVDGDDFFANLEKDTDPAVTLSLSDDPTLDDFCVTGTQTGATTATSGPGCD